MDQSVHAVPPPERRPFSRLAASALVGSLLVLVAAALSALGSRWGWWTADAGVAMLRVATIAAVFVLGLAVAGVVGGRPGGPRRGFAASSLALVLAGVAAGIPLLWIAQSRAAPQAHDVTTDVADPPGFLTAAPADADHAAAAHPALNAVTVAQSPPDAFATALETARSMDWRIVASDIGGGQIEAVERSFWFGFPDAVAVRVRPAEGGGSRVDLRAVSRAGRADVGVDAARLSAYLARLGAS